MKIVIKADKVRLRLWLPLGILKTRIGYNIVQRAITNEVEKRTKNVATEPLVEQQEQEKKEMKQSSLITLEQYLELYKALKQCIKLNGHFNLVEVESHDGERVLIRV